MSLTYEPESFQSYPPHANTGSWSAIEYIKNKNQAPNGYKCLKSIGPEIQDVGIGCGDSVVRQKASGNCYIMEEFTIIFSHIPELSKCCLRIKPGTSIC